MKIQSLKYLAFFLTVALILAAACNILTPFQKPTPSPQHTASAEPTKPGGLLHFENQWVAFDYPEGFKTYPYGDAVFNPYPFHLGGELVAGLADPKPGYEKTLFRSLGIFHHVLPPGSSLEKVMQDAYLHMDPWHSLNDGVLDANGPVTVSGLPAIQKTYRVYSGEPAYEMRDIWLEKDGEIFRLSMWTNWGNPDYFAGFQELADRFLESLVIKNNPVFPTPTAVITPTSLTLGMKFLNFSNDVIAFDYPEKMKLYGAGDTAFAPYPDIHLGSELVAGLEEAKYTSRGTHYRTIGIYRRPIPAGSNLEKIFLEAYSQVEPKYPMQKGMLDANGPVIVDGLAGVQRTYRVYSGEPAYELRDIWVQNGSDLIIICIWTKYTNEDDFAEFQAIADRVIDSLKIIR